MISGGSMLGPGGGSAPPNLAQAPNIFRLLVGLIGSIVISLSRCCLPNDEGPGPPNIFPRSAPVGYSFYGENGAGCMACSPNNFVGEASAFLLPLSPGSRAYVCRDKLKLL